MHSKNKGLLLVGSGAFIYGLESIFAKLCYSFGFTIPLLLFARFFLAALILILFSSLKKRPLFLPKSQWKIGILLGVFSTLTTAFLFKAFSLLPPAVAIIFFYIYPTLTSIFARIFNKAQISKVRIMSIMTCFVGFIFLYWGSFELQFNIWGIFNAVLAAITMAVLMMLLEKYMPEVDKISYSSTVYMFSAIVYFAVAVFNQNIFIIGDIYPLGWLYLALMVLMATLLSNLLLFCGMHTTSAVDAAILNSLEVPSAALFAFIIFGDILIGLQILGALLIIIAAISPASFEKYLEIKKRNALLAEKNIS